MRSFFYGLIVPSLLFITGCSRQSNTHDVVKKDDLSMVKSFKTDFVFTDIDDRTAKITYRNGHLSILRVVQHAIIIHIFSTRADLCRVMLPYLSDLQHSHRKELFVLGIVVPEKTNSSKLRSYMVQNSTTFFISDSEDNVEFAYAMANSLQLGTNYPLPLTVVFYNGQIVTYYEGATPIEMIKNDLYRIGAIEMEKRR